MIAFYENEKSPLRVIESSQMTYPLHLHPQLELLYLSEGNLEVEINRTIHTLEEGDFVAIFPGNIHSYHMNPQSGSVILVIAALNLAGEFSSQIQKHHPEDPVIRKADLHFDVSYAMKNILEEYHCAAPNSSVISCYLKLILARVLPLYQLIPNKDSDYLDLTYRIVNYISQNYHLPLSLEQVAKEVGISKYYLSRIFTQRIHTSFNEYLGNLRVSYAQTLLRSTNDSVTKIAFDSGFESQRTFNRIFQSITGLSPRQYRKEALSKQY